MEVLVSMGPTPSSFLLFRLGGSVTSAEEEDEVSAVTSREFM